MNKKTLAGLLSVLCVLLCALVLLCACDDNKNPTTETGSSEVTTEAPAPVTDPETTAPETEPETVLDTKLTYTVIVVDTDGNPVEGVDVQMCAADGTCFLPVKTGADGVATFEKEEGDYYVTIPYCPEGYVVDSTQKHTFDGTSTEMTVTVEKAAAEVPTEEPTEEVTEPETTEPEETAPVVYVSNDSITIINSDLQIIDTAYPAGGYDEWDKVFTIKQGETGGFWDIGWVALNTDVYEFGYSITGASTLGENFFPGAAYTTTATAEQIAAAREKGATTAGAFWCACAEAALGVGENYVKVLVKLNNDPTQVYVLREYTVILEPAA